MSIYGARWVLEISRGILGKVSDGISCMPETNTDQKKKVTGLSIHFNLYKYAVC